MIRSNQWIIDAMHLVIWACCVENLFKTTKKCEERIDQKIQETKLVYVMIFLVINEEK